MQDLTDILSSDAANQAYQGASRQLNVLLVEAELVARRSLADVQR